MAGPSEDIKRLLALQTQADEASSFEEAADRTGRLVDAIKAFKSRDDRQPDLDYLRERAITTTRPRHEREGAISLLSALAIPKFSIAVLADCLEDADLAIRKAAVQAIGVLDAAEVAPVVLHLQAMLAEVAGQGLPLEKALRRTLKKHLPTEAWRSAAELAGILNREPVTAADFVKLGARLRNIEDFDRARFAGTLSAFGEAVRRDPNLAAALRGVADAHAARGELEEAIDGFKRVLALDPASREAASGLQSAERKLASLESELETRRQQAASAPDDVQAHMAVAMMAAMMRRWSDCLTAAERAVRLAPDEATPQFAAATALVFLDREQEARDHLARGVALGGGPGILEVVPDPDRVYRLYKEVRRQAQRDSP